MATMTECHHRLPEPENLSWSARWASIAIREQLVEIQRGIEALPTPGENAALKPRDQLARIGNVHCQQPSNKLPDASKDRTYKVGIVGAGCAGLFTGLIFDHLKQSYGLNVEYEILESNDVKRLGGRLYTHYFNDPKDNPHDYYDVGAMRFPESSVMQRVFCLFKELHMDKRALPKEATSKLESSEKVEPGDLVPYYLSGLNNTELYNDVQIMTPKGPSRSTAKSFKVDGLRRSQANRVPSDVIKFQIQEFIDQFEDDPAEGWKYLLARGDKYSVRQWLLEHLDFNTTEWLETYSYGTSWYDQALSEMILEEMNFSWTGDWWCVMGGAQELAKRMFGAIESRQPSRIEFGKKVVKMERLFDVERSTKISVRVAGESDSRIYDAVFNSAPLGNMQRMDLRGLNLNWGTKQAIRSLGYGASCKIGIRFKTLWWIKELGIKEGGASKTDLPIRNCVYPSYNMNDPTDKPGVLLASYTWSQEAQRIGTLINSDSDESKSELKELLIDNLARLHSNSPKTYSWIREIIETNYMEYHAYDWYRDPGTTGAFAYFGPGQFRNMFPYIIRNDGTHIIIGEAASAHHAWVVGALESAVRGVYQFLYHNSTNDHTIKRVMEAYNERKVEAPYGPLPAEFDRTKDVKPLGGDSEGVSSEGEWLRQGVLVEEIRHQQGGDMLVPSQVTKEQVLDFVPVKA